MAMWRADGLYCLAWNHDGGKGIAWCSGCCGLDIFEFNSDAAPAAGVGVGVVVWGLRTCYIVYPVATWMRGA